MKLVSYLIVGMVIPLGIGFSQIGQTKITERNTRVIRTSNRVQVQLEVDPISIQPGATVLALIKAKNVSSKTVRLQDSFPENDFRVVVTDATGREAPRTEWGDKFIHGDLVVLRNTVLDLKPGEEQQVTIEITRIFQITQTGTYSVQVNRMGIWTEIDEDNKKLDEIGYSNVVQLQVLP